MQPEPVLLTRLLQWPGRRRGVETEAVGEARDAHRSIESGIDRTRSARPRKIHTRHTAKSVFKAIHFVLIRGHIASACIIRSMLQVNYNRDVRSPPYESKSFTVRCHL